MRNRNIIIFICKRKKYIFKQLGFITTVMFIIYQNIFFWIMLPLLLWGENIYRPIENSKYDVKD